MSTTLVDGKGKIATSEYWLIEPPASSILFRNIHTELLQIGLIANDNKRNLN